MRRLRAHLDAALIVSLAVLGVGEAGTHATGANRWVQTAWVAVLVVPLSWRRRRPLAAVTLLALGGVAHQVLSPAPTPFVSTVLAVLIAFYSAGAHAALRPALSALGIGLLAFWISDALQHHPPSEYFASAVLVGGSWLSGRALRGTRARNARLVSLTTELAAEREARARDAVLAERGRIAAELHDVVGHCVSVISLQAQAAEAALAHDAPAVRPPLLAITSAAQTAMQEMRRLVTLLHDDDPHGDDGSEHPVPSYGDIPALVEENRRLGLQVELEIVGCAPAGAQAGVQLATYRIVQEGLANVRRHSEAARARVAIRFGDEATFLDVLDEGPRGRYRDTGGYGLIGVRTRARSCSGTVSAGPHAGGWALRVVLPHTRPVDDF